MFEKHINQLSPLTHHENYENYALQCKQNRWLMSSELT
jgi:hypothetical protein